MFLNWFAGLANATAILEESYQEYPNSAVFLFFRGLVSRLKVGSVSCVNGMPRKRNNMWLFIPFIVKTRRVWGFLWVYFIWLLKQGKLLRASPPLLPLLPSSFAPCPRSESPCDGLYGDFLPERETIFGPQRLDLGVEPPRIKLCRVLCPLSLGWDHM